MASALIRLGADVDVRNRDGETPLSRAARAGNVPLVRVLLAAGADVHAAGPAGATALAEAVRAGQEEIVAMLRAADLEGVPVTAGRSAAAPAPRRRDVTPSPRSAAGAAASSLLADPAAGRSGPRERPLHHVHSWLPFGFARFFSASASAVSSLPSRGWPCSSLSAASPYTSRFRSSSSVIFAPPNAAPANSPSSRV